jgi:hypothetical protein
MGNQLPKISKSGQAVCVFISLTFPHMQRERIGVSAHHPKTPESE